MGALYLGSLQIFCHGRKPYMYGLSASFAIYINTLFTGCKPSMAGAWVWQFTSKIFLWMQALHGWSPSFAIYIKILSLDASPPWLEPELCNLHQNLYPGCKPSMDGARALQFTSKFLHWMQALHGWSPSFAIYIKILSLDASPPLGWSPSFATYIKTFSLDASPPWLEPELCSLHQNFFIGRKPSMVGARASQFTSKFLHWMQDLYDWSPSFAMYTEKIFLLEASPPWLSSAIFIKKFSLNASPLSLEPSFAIFYSALTVIYEFGIQALHP